MKSRKSYYLRNALLTFFIFAFFTQVCDAQTYRYIGMEDGLGSQKVYRILQDSLGYMWFLTQEGPNRYDGKEIRHYELTDQGKKFSIQSCLNWLYMAEGGILWGISQKGRIFRYDPDYNRFELVYTPPLSKKGNVLPNITYGYMDRTGYVWLCGKEQIILFDTHTGNVLQPSCNIASNITAVEQTGPDDFFIGTESGLYRAKLEKHPLSLSCMPAYNLRVTISELFFSADLNKLFIGTSKQGVWIFSPDSPSGIHSDETFGDVNITRIVPFNKNEVLIATDGKGIYRMDVDSCRAVPYIVADYTAHYGMNDNNINDIYVDAKARIWIANYFNGITVCDNRYGGYLWTRHSIGNRQSLVNNQVHDVIEDSEGDLWFGTSNGISLYKTKTGEWHSFFSTFDKESGDKNHIFLTLCEGSPGIILAGGFTSGIYQINKRTLKVDYISSSAFFHLDLRPDQYIRDIRKDSDGNIWSGGFYNLKCFDIKRGRARLYPGLSSINCIQEKVRSSIWVGTSRGLYLLDKESGNSRNIDLPVESAHVCALYQAENGVLYIGTEGAGLLLYDPGANAFAQYHKENCALISNNIHTILPKPNGDMLLCTENGIVHFSPQNMSFSNWTREQGLMSVCFNPGAGILRSDGRFILGSNDGVIGFPADIKIPRPSFSPILLSDLIISYQTVYPGEEGSPLQASLNDTRELKLKYGQNTFSLQAFSINYDYPSNVLYSWKLEGFHKEWSTPSSNGLIRFTNLPAGKYTLHIRSVSNEEKYKSYGQRSLSIIISPPVWASPWAMVGYVVLFILACTILFRIMALRKQKKISDEKTRFFINTAHDIRTPLTLIKAPLEELNNRDLVNKEGKKHVGMALRNVDVLLRLVTNLINFERIDTYSSHLYIAEYELGAYISGICDTFRSYAKVKHIQLVCESSCNYLNVWFDRDKMDSILKNILSNALKYTPENGSIHVRASECGENWCIEVRDTGIGIPHNEQKSLFRTYFRGSNAINLKVSGSGIGLMLVHRLVRLHGGNISIESGVGQGTCIKLLFRKGNAHFKKASITAHPQEQTISMPEINTAFSLSTANTSDCNLSRRILIVEDNDDLRIYLVNTLGQDYKVQSCRNGNEALDILSEFNPDLVLSDIMMPELAGDELCAAIKGNIETSHIPVLLLTALGDEKNILEGLKVGADDYITKPFSVGILKASINRLIANRLLLRKKYGSADFDNEQWPKGCKDTLDWKFISSVRKNIEKNMTNPNFTVDTLCALHNMSRSSFYNKLKSLTDGSPTDYIRLIRMQRAEQLLREGEYSITEIAEMTGFCDAKYFREVFRKHFGVSPSEYKVKREQSDRRS